MITEEEVPERVAQLIRASGETHGAFARRIGMDASKLSKSLHRTRRFRASELSRIAESTGIATDWLIGGSHRATGSIRRVDRDHAGARRAGATTSPASSGDERRRHILETAARLIAERGYHRVRVVDIALECHTSTAAVHYYFPAKQDLLNEALRSSVEDALGRQSTQLRAVENGRDRLICLIDLQLPRSGQVRQEWSVWMQFWSEASIHPELRALHNDFYARWRETVVRIIRRGQRQAVFRHLDVERAAARFTALTDGLAIQVLTGAAGATVERMRSILVDFVDTELTVPGNTAAELQSATAVS